MNDNELFELCKSVYEATGWDGTDKLIQKYDFKPTPEVVANSELSIQMIDAAIKYNGSSVEWQAPLYTSDYLLEKLPKYIEYGNRRLTLMPTSGGLRWDASYDDITVADDSEMDCFAKTPLKALLKLTLELHKKGLLDAKDN